MERSDLLWIGIAMAAAGGLPLIIRREHTLPWWGVDFFAAFVGVGGGFVIFESQRSRVFDRVELSNVFDGVFTGWLQASLVAVLAAGALVLAMMLVHRSMLGYGRVIALSVGAVLAAVAVRLFENGLPTF